MEGGCVGAYVGLSAWVEVNEYWIWIPGLVVCVLADFDLWDNATCSIIEIQVSIEPLPFEEKRAHTFSHKHRGDVREECWFASDMCIDIEF